MKHQLLREREKEKENGMRGNWRNRSGHSNWLSDLPSTVQPETGKAKTMPNNVLAMQFTFWQSNFCNLISLSIFSTLSLSPYFSAYLFIGHPFP